MNALSAQQEAEQKVKHKLNLQSIINENKRSEILVENERANLMKEELNISRNAVHEQRELREQEQREEQLELDRMAEEHRKFKEKLKRNRVDALHQHKEELMDQLKERQSKLSEMARKHRIQSFAAALKEEEEAAQSEWTEDEQRMKKTIDLVQCQIREIHQKELELEQRGKEVQEQNAFEKVAKDAEEQITGREQMKYAKIREEMMQEMRRKEEQLKQRHEEIMKKLMQQREQQILKIGQEAQRKIELDERNNLQQEFEKQKDALDALEQSYNEQQDAVRQTIAEIPSGNHPDMNSQRAT